MDFSGYVYKKGFIFSREKIKPRKDWESFEIGGGKKNRYILHYDPCNGFHFSQRGKYWCALLGRVLDTNIWTTDIDRVADILSQQLEDSEEKFYNYIDCLNGRFVIFYGDKNRCRVMNDATGMRSVYYHTEKCMIASHYGLIADCCEAEEEPYYSKYNTLRSPKPWALPGDMTPYKNIRILIPNHEIKTENMQISRFYPRRDHTDHSPDEIAENMADNIRRQAELLAENNTLLFSVTGGNDSRVSMAASRNIREKCVYFSYQNVKEEEKFNKDKVGRKKDCAYGQYISDLYGLKFIPLNLDHEVDEGLIKTLQKNHYHQHIVTTIEPYIEQLPKGLHIRSNLIEIIRDINYLYLYNEKKSALENLVKWMQYEEHRTAEVSEAVLDYYKRNEYDKIFNYEFAHMVYWEYRMATWMNASVLAEEDMAFETHMLLNCRKLLEYGFCIPKYYRDLNYLTKMIVKNLWPELLFKIENTDDTLFDDYCIETSGEIRIKDEADVFSGNDKVENRKPVALVMARRNGVLFGFGECRNKAGDYIGLGLNLNTKNGSEYQMQIHMLPPRANKLPAGTAEFGVFLNGKQIYSIDVSYLVNRINQINVFFKANETFQRLVFKLVCKKDIDNSQNGSNGVIDIKSVTIKEDAIPYSDRIYVISTTNIATKSFFRRYFGIESEQQKQISFYTPEEKNIFISDLQIKRPADKGENRILPFVNAQGMYELEIGDAESENGKVTSYRMYVRTDEKVTEKKMSVGKNAKLYINVPNGTKDFEVYAEPLEEGSIVLKNISLTRLI